jgi:hypothetical protein
VRIILHNNSMMRHPMHLHGHFFRVLNGQGDHAPLKNVLDIMPMETDTIEFAATEEGDWFFHCHILYHMMSGMGRVFTYPPGGTFPTPCCPMRSKAGAFPARGQGMALHGAERLRHQRHRRRGHVDEQALEPAERMALGLHRRNTVRRVEAHFGRYFGKMQWLFRNIGIGLAHPRRHGDNPEENLFGQPNTKNSRSVAHIGCNTRCPCSWCSTGASTPMANCGPQLMREDIAAHARACAWT